MTALTTYVFKDADESKHDQTVGYADDTELTLSLEANTAYWIEIGLLVNVPYYYATTIHAKPVYTGDLDTVAPHHVLMERAYSYPYNAYLAGQVGMWELDATILGTESTVPSGSGNNTADLGMLWWAGRINTDTAGDLRIQWHHYDNGYAGSAFPTTVKAGSWIIATPLNICPIAENEVFTITAGDLTFNGNDYVGTDPDGFVTGTPFGSVTPDPLVSTLRVLECEANVPTGTGPPQTIFGFALQNAGGAPPSASVFTSISWTGPSGVITLLSADANPSYSSTSSDARFWGWDISENCFVSGNDYDITIVY